MRPHYQEIADLELERRLAVPDRFRRAEGFDPAGTWQARLDTMEEHGPRDPLGWGSLALWLAVVLACLAVWGAFALWVLPTAAEALGQAIVRAGEVRAPW